MVLMEYFDIEKCMRINLYAINRKLSLIFYKFMKNIKIMKNKIRNILKQKQKLTCFYNFPSN